MKILSITLLFFTLVTSSAKEESNAVFFECQPGTSDYCSGWADGRQEPGGSPSDWLREYNKCLVSKGCPELVEPGGPEH